MSIVSIYLIFTIGFKGGSCLGVNNQCSLDLFGLAIAGIIIGLLQPLLHYFILRKTTALNKENSAVIAAQYGSISIVTFATTISFLTNNNIHYDSFMAAIAGIMEIPALFTGLLIIQKNIFTKNFFKTIIGIFKSIFLCQTIVAIFIGFLVGFISKFFATSTLSYIITRPFDLMLIVFMLDIGIKIASQKESVKHIRPALILFGIYMPIINGILGIIVASYFINSIGSILLFAILIASASYIAVPAVMRAQAKNAQEAIYMPMALGITLPFNILVGIPLFYYLANIVKNLI